MRKALNIAFRSAVILIGGYFAFCIIGGFIVAASS